MTVVTSQALRPLGVPEGVRVPEEGQETETERC